MRPTVLPLRGLAIDTFLLACLGLAIHAQTPPDQVLLKEYHPRSILKIPQTRVEKAHYPAIDVHSHDYARTDVDIDRV